MPPLIFWLFTSKQVSLFHRGVTSTSIFIQKYSLNTQKTLLILFIVISIFLLFFGVYMTLLISYNLFYLKTSKHTVGIFGIFEFFTAFLALLATAIYGYVISFGIEITKIEMTNWWGILFSSMIDFIKSLGIFYGIIFVFIRSFENINKRFTNEEFILRAFLNLKLGHDNLGNPYFSENKIKLVKKIENIIKTININDKNIKLKIKNNSDY